MTHYRKDSAMWNKIDSTIGETTPDSLTAFTSMMGFKKTAYGSFWKQTAYDEAIEISIVND